MTNIGIKMRCLRLPSRIGGTSSSAIFIKGYEADHIRTAEIIIIKDFHFDIKPVWTAKI
ncbi:MAG: hypothetical protein QMC80_01210 [Thermoplasmatales archaeon]|nr:hypothetical protein [Thermoplasmatales archaeon]